MLLVVLKNKELIKKKSKTLVMIKVLNKSFKAHLNQVVKDRNSIKTIKAKTLLFQLHKILKIKIKAKFLIIKHNKSKMFKWNLNQNKIII